MRSLRASANLRSLHASANLNSLSIIFSICSQSFRIICWSANFNINIRLLVSKFQWSQKNKNTLRQQISMVSENKNTLLLTIKFWMNTENKLVIFYDQVFITYSKINSLHFRLNNHSKKNLREDKNKNEFSHLLKPQLYN